jgi:hypothetical protein
MGFALKREFGKMTIASATYQCDRDGVQAEGTGEQLPAEWVRLLNSATVYFSGVSALTGTLCPQCAAAFIEFMTAMGDGGPFKKPTTPPAPAATVGDFCAVNTDAVGLPTTPVVMTPPTIQSGNAGNWYDPATGRYTPPAGRYFLHATVTAALSTGSTGIQVNLRKNGEAISAPGGQVTGAGSNYGDPANVATVDANGTDYFDFTCFASGNASSTLIQFLAFPV